MARLNQGLLLLAKIENYQFQDVQLVNLSQLLIEKLQDMEEVLSFREISVVLHQQLPFEVQLSAAPADSLVTNLVKNAIKYNQSGGCIELKSDGE